MKNYRFVPNGTQKVALIPPPPPPGQRAIDWNHDPSPAEIMEWTEPELGGSSSSFGLLNLQSDTPLPPPVVAATLSRQSLGRRP